MNISLKDINRYADVKGTKALYAALDNHGKENAAAYNFSQNIAMRECAVTEYFNALGVNPYLFQVLYVESVDAAQQTVLYWGVYPLKVFNKEEALQFIHCRNEKDDSIESIHTAFGFTLFLDEWKEDVAIYFEASLPWLMSPSIEKAKYENNPTLPVIDVKEMRQCF